MTGMPIVRIFYKSRIMDSYIKVPTQVCSTLSPMGHAWPYGRGEAIAIGFQGVHVQIVRSADHRSIVLVSPKIAIAHSYFELLSFKHRNGRMSCTT